MTVCKCGCGREATTPAGFAGRACVFAEHNRRRRADALAKRANPPLCAWCHVYPVHWNQAKKRWYIYCDRYCTAQARVAKRTPEQKIANALRLYASVQERRAKNPKVRELLDEALAGRDSLTAEEALEFGLRVDRKAWQRGYHAHGNAKERQVKKERRKEGSLWTTEPTTTHFESS